MGLTLLSLFIIGLMSLSLGSIFSIWFACLAAGLLLLLTSPLSRWIDIPLRLGKFPISHLAPLLWTVAGILYVYKELAQPSVKERQHIATPPLQQDLVANAHVNQTHLRVEKDQLVYTLTVRYKKHLQPTFPNFTAHPTFNGPFVMPADKPPKMADKTDPKKGILTKQWNITLIPISTGPLDTPRFEIKYLKKGKWKKVIVPSIGVEVSELGKPSQLLASLKPAKPPVLPERPLSQTPWVWLAVFSTLLFLSLLGAAWLRKMNHRKAPDLPPHEWLAKEWSTLKRKQLLKKEQYKTHYFSLSEIFRGYLERRFQFPALENTSEEILRWCKRNDSVKQTTYLDIRTLLQSIDSIKFAGHIPSADDLKDMAQRLQQIVDHTSILPDDHEPAKTHEKGGAE